ncbi:MAG: NAD(P)-binding domain-containing protein [Crenarchaeota archaeon]|nr:NAD(P)-binding domain-containing protein [Thermoproteota archaeon]MDW8033784.1 NAD(P)-dependent oxidoreductase [Nitrososphaerota archaeon]
MRKILVVEADSKTVSTFNKMLKGWGIAFEKEIVNKVDLTRYVDTEILSVFVFSKVSIKVIESLPNLKLIVTRSSGFDHIDIEAASKRGILVSNIPGYGSLPVAEHVFALLLAVLRKIVKADLMVRSSKWFSPLLQGSLINGKTFGIIGTGAIGERVARIAKAFGAEVIAYDVFKKTALEAEGVLRYVKLEEVLERSDIISIHVPLTRETYHMINRDSIARMKKHAVLINTSRGQVVDQEALVEALKTGKLSGAGLDVLEKEPPEPDDPILKLENVVLTPHIAWNTVEAEDYILQSTIDVIKAFANGNPLNIVNLKELEKQTLAPIISSN